MSEDNLLRRARLDRGMELQDVARHTCLSPGIVARIDSGRWDELPAGIYARSYIRSFAAAVGVNPAAALAACEDRLPRADDPLPALLATPPSDPPAWWVLVTAWAGGSSAWLRRAPRRQRRPPLPARTCDAFLLFGGYLAIVQLTALVAGAPAPAVMEHLGVVLLWLFLVVLYFLLLGGLGGQTVGDWAVGTSSRPGTDGAGQLRAILQRAFLF